MAGCARFSNLESYDARPLHATDSEAQMRVRLHWSTPVGPIEDVRDFRLANAATSGKSSGTKYRCPMFPRRSSR